MPLPLFPPKPVEARRVGNSLVAAFHKAEPPLVWRFDLERNHSFTLALQGGENQWQLGLASAAGEFQAVAHFASRKDAEQAFAETEKVLAQGKNGWISSVLKITGIFALLLALLFCLSVGKNMLQHMRKPPYTPATGAMPAKPDIKPGVPLPADEFLTPP